MSLLQSTLWRTRVLMTERGCRVMAVGASSMRGWVSGCNALPARWSFDASGHGETVSRAASHRLALSSVRRAGPAALAGCHSARKRSRCESRTSAWRSGPNRLRRIGSLRRPLLRERMACIFADDDARAEPASLVLCWIAALLPFGRRSLGSASSLQRWPASNLLRAMHVSRRSRPVLAAGSLDCGVSVAPSITAKSRARAQAGDEMLAPLLSRRNEERGQQACMA